MRTSHDDGVATRLLWPRAHKQQAAFSSATGVSLNPRAFSVFLLVVRAVCVQACSRRTRVGTGRKVDPERVRTSTLLADQSRLEEPWSFSFFCLFSEWGRTLPRTCSASVAGRSSEGGEKERHQQDRALEWKRSDITTETTYFIST